MSGSGGGYWWSHGTRPAPRPGVRCLHWLTLIAAAMCLALATGVPGVSSVSAHPASPAHPGDNDGTLTIIRPAVNPASHVPEGPAGANIVAQIQHAAPNTTFSLGYTQEVGADCVANVVPIPNPPPITTNAQGDKTFGFTWPAPATTGRFLLCATASGDTASNPLKSTTPYLVDSTAAPAITVMLAPNPTATGTPATGSTYTNGDQAIVSGTDFWPAGVAIDVYITDVPKPQNPAQLGTQATIVNRQIDPTDSNGTFAVTITVKVPAGQTGVFYVDAVSRDGSTADGYLPADLASQSITVVSPAPTPTVSPTATADPTPATKTTTTPTSTGDGGSGHILAAAGLGTLSVLLLVIGSMLLISAGRRPQPGG